MGEHGYKDPFNIKYLVTFILFLLIPLLPMVLSWLKYFGWIGG